MTWAVAAAIGGSAVLGAFASDRASKRQSDAAGNAAGMTMEQYQQTRDDLMPWQDTGKAANARMAELLGIATPATRNPSLVMPTKEQFTKTQQVYQPIGNAMQGRSPFGFFNSQPTPTSTFDQAGYDKAMADYNTAFRTANTNPADYGSLLHNFTGQDLASEPGYQFGLSEGEKGINRMAMVGSGRNNGATMKALLKYNEDYAGTKYNDAFNRDSTNKSRTYGFLTGASGQGENAAAQTGGLGANAAGNAGNFLTQGADASAAGTVGMANAVSGGVGNYLNYTNNQNMFDYLKSLRGSTSSAAGSPFGYSYGPK